MPKKKMPVRLSRTKQCEKCPWKVSTNPYDIPDGYSVEKHKALDSTIAKNDGYYPDLEFTVMACHESTPADPQSCVGWLHNQLGVGNNIGLRLWASRVENIGDIETVGEQHQHFRDTLPQE